MLALTLKYLFFFLKSFYKNTDKNPFIFSLITQSLRVKTSSKKLEKFLKCKKEVLNNKNFITVTDFGSGSKVFNSNSRQISKIAKVAGISNRKATLLIRLVNYLEPKTILEIGTSLGLGTCALKIGNKKSSIITLEGCPETSKIAKALFQENQFENINLITGNFKDTLQKATKNIKFDLIYFDGNHTKKATLEYFNLCLSTVNNNSVFIFDDIHWSNEMEDAWKEIKQHPKVTTTIDTFQWGIVFFRKELQKQHYYVRV